MEIYSVKIDIIIVEQTFLLQKKEKLHVGRKKTDEMEM